MGSFRDGYSNFAYLQALSARVVSDAAGTESGDTIDRQGYETVTFAIACASLASAGAMAGADYFELKLYHGLASALGASAFSVVPNSLLIHSVVSAYANASEDGIFQILDTGTDLTDSAQVFLVGYKGDKDHRYVRFTLSNVSAASSMWCAGVAVLGLPANAPVNEPVNTP